MRLILAVLVLGQFIATFAQAQGITIATVTREPFSMEFEGEQTGFSVELMNEAAKRIGRDVTWLRLDTFGDMLAAVQDGRADGAIANISITAEREAVMDFSQPMFDSGIQILLKPTGDTGSTLFNALFTPQIGLLIIKAIGLLFGGGMLMWLFERKRQPYFERTARDAIFPAFWWALNLVVNGGFEERMPQSRPGRVFAVFLVIGSLFVVSIFVANITAAMTVSAISHQFDNLSDLDSRQVGTVSGSTSQAFLNRRTISHRGYLGTTELFDAFEGGEIDAVVFDGPILAYYASSVSSDEAELMDPIYRPENYGIAFPSGSDLREALDLSLLSMREDGSFDVLRANWFGSSYGVSR